MNTLRSILYPLLFLFFLSGCAHQLSITDESSADQGLLWEVVSPAGKTSHLFGTIHSEDPRVTIMPVELTQRLDSSSTLALEIEFSAQASQYAISSMFFVDGQRLDRLISRDEYEKCVEAMSKRGIPRDQVVLMKPWAIFTLMSMPEAETGLYLDMLLYQRAKKRGLKLVGLESIQEQISAFDDMPMDAQTGMLSETLSNQDDFSTIMDETIKIYLSRDLGAMLSLNDRYMKLMPENLAHVFEQRIIIERNNRMFKRALPLLERGNAFIGVGALHLPGKTGLIHQLRQAGYALTPVY